MIDTRQVLLQKLLIRLNQLSPQEVIAYNLLSTEYVPNAGKVNQDFTFGGGSQTHPIMGG